MSGWGVSPHKARRGLVGVLAANAFSWSATRLLSVALPWFVLSSTGSATQMGLVVFCQMVPFVISQVLAGPLIDRLGPRRVSITGDLVAMLAMIVAPALHLVGLLPLWVLLILVGVLGAADGPANAAKAVFVPSATAAANVPLERGTGLVGAVERTATTVGPAIAGIVVAAVGGVYTLWASGILFALGAAVVAATLSDPRREPSDVTAHIGYLRQLQEGVTYLRGERLLRSIISMVAITNLLDQAFTAVLLPLWVKNSGYGPQIVGLVISVFAAASVVASLLAAGIGRRLPRRIVYLVGLTLGGVPRFLVMALGAPLAVVLAVFLIGGLGSGFVNPIIGAITYERIPAALLGRVQTFGGALAWSGIPFGGLVAGELIALTSLSPTLWIIGGVYLLAIIIPGARPEWAQMRSRPNQSETTPTASPASAPDAAA